MQKNNLIIFNTQSDKQTKTLHKLQWKGSKPTQLVNTVSKKTQHHT